jgi:hypothetical protein
LPPGYVIIELDDGDSRDFHVDSIRILPPDYPIVGEELRTLFPQYIREYYLNTVLSQ